MKQLDPKAVWLFLLNFILRSSIPVILLSFSIYLRLINKSSIIIWTFLAFYFILYFALCFVWAQLSYHFYRYELTDSGFRKEYGVIYKKYVTIPYERIQNIDIHRGIAARILGLSDLYIQTAGTSAVFRKYTISGTDAEGRLPGLSYKDAELLRDELIEKTNQKSKSV